MRLADEAVNAIDGSPSLVNNAGFGHSGPFTAMPVDAVRRLIEVDRVAAIELTHALLPAMVEQKRGAVSFVTSIAGRTGVAGEAVYSATKRDSMHSPRVCAPRPPDRVSTSAL